MLKSAIVKFIGRDKANRLSAPYHDWQARRRTRRNLAALAKKDLRVNLGCGPIPLAGWVNVDIARGPHIDVVWDLQNGLPFASDSCTAIFCEHVIEHLSKSDGAKLLKECHRVLQSGGVIRLSTPDARRFLQAYAGDGEFFKHPAFSTPAETPLDRVNHMMREDGQHLWIYDSDSLMLALRQAGFSKVVEQEVGISMHPQMQHLDTQERAFESIYVEAAK